MPPTEHDELSAILRLGKDLTPGRDWKRRANIASILGGGPVAARIGRFAVLEQIGRGAMGEVFAANDEKLDRKVALKLLTGQISPAALDRFTREAKSLARLSHPNIVQIHEVGEHEGSMFIAMELVEGLTLGQWLAPGTRAWREVVAVFVEAGQGLAAAHAAGLVHRDFKPDNVIVGGDGRVRVLDFGLARAAARTDESPASLGAEPVEDAMPTPANSASDRLTRTGTLVGTPSYMAPEQLRGGESTAQADQFSFCVALHEGLFGVRPFVGRDIFELADAIEQRRMQAPLRAVPRRVASVVLRGLASKPQDRWPSMEALVAALRHVVAPRRGWNVVAVAGGLAVLGGGLWSQAELRTRCTGAAQKIEEVWNVGRKQEIRAALLATKASYAEATSDEIEARFDARAAAWIDQHREICEATQIRREQSPAVMDEKMRCLERQRAVLADTLEVLADADAKGVENAVALVSGLPDPKECDDLERVEADAPALPDDPELAGAVQAERDRLAQIEILTRAGRHDAAEAAADEVVKVAEALGYPPLLAEAKLRRGTTRQSLSRNAEALEDLKEAYLLATEHQQLKTETSAAVRLASAIGLQEGRYEEGMLWGKNALALSRRPGIARRLEAQALGGLSSMLRELGKLAEARDFAEQALGIVEEEEGPDSLSTARYLESLAELHNRTRNYDEALALVTRALEIREAALGPDHPDVARGYLTLGSVHSEMLSAEEALVAQRKALAILENLGYQHPSLPAALSSIGLAMSRKGQFREAIPYLERAIEMMEHLHGPQHPSIARTLTALADAHQNLQEWEAAVKAHERARDIRRATLPEGSFDTAINNMGLGQLLFELGRLEEAKAASLEAARDLEASGATQGSGRNRMALGATYGNLSRIAQVQDDVAAGIEYAEKAVELGNLPDEPWKATWARTILFQALWRDPSQRRRAHEVALQAIEAEGRSPSPHTQVIENVRGWIRDNPLPEGK